MNKSKTHLPNFLVVGTAKSGTTSLFYYLSQHPEIHLPIKESHFFNKADFFQKELKNSPKKDKNEIIVNREDYDKAYEFAEKPNGVIGEIGTGYLYNYEYSIPKIKKTLGDVPIIIILRNPIDRAYSSFQHFVKLGKGDKSFEEALLLEEQRIKEGWSFMWHHKQMGFYSDQIEAFQQAFSKVKITLFEDLKNDGDKYMESLFNFIGVQSSVKVDSKTIHNQSKIPKSSLFSLINSDKNLLKMALRPLFRKLYSSEKRRSIKEKARGLHADSYARMNEETRKGLIEEYRSDILRLEKLLNRELKHWLQ